MTHLYCMYKTAWFLPQTEWDWHKCGMYVQGRLVGIHVTHFHSHYIEVTAKGTFWKMFMAIFPLPKCSQTLNQLCICPTSRQGGMTRLVPLDTWSCLESNGISIFGLSLNLRMTQSPKDSFASQQLCRSHIEKNTLRTIFVLGIIKSVH